MRRRALVSLSIAALFALSAGAATGTRQAAGEPASSAKTAEVRVLEVARAGITAVQFSSSGEWLAAASLDGKLRIWNTGDWRLEHEIELGGELYALAFAPDVDLVAVTREGGRVFAFDAATAERRFEASFQGWSLALAFTPSGGLLVGCSEGKLRQYDVVSGAPGRTLDVGGEVLALALSSDGRQVAVGAPIRVFDVATGARLRTLPGFGQGGLAISPDDACLAAAEWTGGARAFSFENGRPAGTLRIDVERNALFAPGSTRFTVNMPAASIAFSRDGTLLATGAANCEVQLWKVEHGAVATPAARTLAGHRMSVTAVSFSPDGRLLASGSLDHTVRVFDLAAR